MVWFSSKLYPSFQLYYHSFNHVIIDLRKDPNIDCFDSKVTGKWQFYDHFQLVFCQLYQDLSQNWGSNGHFEMLNGSKSNLVQKLWPNCKNAKNKSSANSLKFETDKRTFYNHFWSFFCQLSEHLSQNWDSDGHFEVLYESKN